MARRWRWMGGAAILLGIGIGGVLLWPRPQGPYRAPAPRLPKELIGEWVQVYPKKGAFTRIRLNADSSMSFAGTDTAFQSREDFEGAVRDYAIFRVLGPPEVTGNEAEGIGVTE